MATARDLDRACTVLKKALKNLMDAAHAHAGTNTCRAALGSPVTAEASGSPADPSRIRIERYKKTRFWAVYDDCGALICLTVYRKGAEEVRRRLTQKPAECQPPLAEVHTLERQGDTHGISRKDSE